MFSLKWLVYVFHSAEGRTFSYDWAKWKMKKQQWWQHRDWRRRRKIEIDLWQQSHSSRRRGAKKTDKPKFTHTHTHTRTKCELGEPISFQMFFGSNKFAAQGRHITWCCKPSYIHTNVTLAKKKFESKKVASIINPLTQSHSLSDTQNICFHSFPCLLHFSYSVHSHFRTYALSFGVYHNRRFFQHTILLSLSLFNSCRIRLPSLTLFSLSHKYMQTQTFTQTHNRFLALYFRC